MNGTGERRAPASVGQRLLSAMEQHRGASGVLNIPMVCRLRGRVDTSGLKCAINHITARHESLRTTFSGRFARLTQVIHAPGPVPVTLIDVGDTVDAEVACRAAVADELRASVDPAAWPVRWTVVRLRDDDHVLCINLHHYVTDAWSNGLIWRDLRALYREAIGAGDADLPPVQWQYERFAHWQRERLAGPEGRRHQEYWARRLSGAEPPVLPVHTAHSTVEAGPAGTVRFALDAPVVADLTELARTERTTLFTVFLAACYALLYVRSGRTDLAVSTMLANRARREVAQTVGFFANMTVLRTQLPDRPSLLDVVRQARRTVFEALAHQEFPLQLLPASLFQAGSGRVDDLVFQQVTGSFETTAVADLRATPEEPVDQRRPRFDLEVILEPVVDGALGVVRYATGRFSHDWAADFAASYVALASAAAERPDRPLSALA